MENENNIPIKQFLNKRIVAVIVLILLLLFVSHYSFVSIQVSGQGAAGGSLSYQLTKSGSTKSSTSTTSSSKITRLVARGSYEVVVSQDNYNSFAIVKAHGFFTKATVKTVLKQQKSRQFVGDNPGTCSAYMGSNLISYACGGLYENTRIHVPATADTPTYTITDQSNPAATGYIHSLIYLDGQYLALIQHPLSGELAAYYSIASVRSDLSIMSNVNLPALNAAKSYQMAAYKNGVIAYASNFTQAFYYAFPAASQSPVLAQSFNFPTLDPKSTPLTLGSAPKASLKATWLAVSNGTNVLALYSSATQAGSSSGQAEVVDSSPSGNKVFKFKEAYSSVASCGANRMCLVGPKAMEVYDISGKKASLLFVVGNVSATLEVGQSFLAVDNYGALNLNTDTGSGTYEYTFGDYQSCGLQPSDASSYVLCLVNAKKDRVALLIDQRANDSGSIDQKIEQLLKQSEIKDVSAYGNYIFVSPNLGAITYQKSLGYYDYDPTTKNIVNGEINTEVTKLGIDTKTYQIINPYAP